MPDANIDTGPIKIVGTADCVARPGSVRLDEFPLLVFAPEQFGLGIRTEDKGVSVAQIAEAFAVNPNANAIAAQFATTVDHIADAIRYAIATALAQATTPTEEAK
jgi:uncharacterized protein (DUF433 family)